MSQQQFFGESGGAPGVPGIQSITGNDSLPVFGSGTPTNVNIIGNTIQGVNVNKTNSNTETITVADATTTQKGVVLLPSQEIAFNYTNVTNAMSPYTVTATDYYISCDTTLGAVSILLPNTTTSYREFVVKDRLGNSATNNITVTTVGGAVNIDGTTSYVFTDNYESLEMIFNGTSYETF